MALLPPKKWQLPVIVLLGIIVGLTVFILKQSNAVSYLSDDPQACINCHVMNTEYITWRHSSHGAVTNCNDCHVPHDSFLRKYAFKAKDGLYHASIFTMRAEPEVIRMHEPGQRVVQENCIRCHNPQITDAKESAWISNHVTNRTERQCWECHREVPHGRVKGLSAVGLQLEPLPNRALKSAIVPNWIKNKKAEKKQKNN